MFADNDHQAVFGHLVGEHFTAAEAAEYLEIPESALQGHVAAGRLHLTNDGTFPVPELRAFKKSLKVYAIENSIEDTHRAGGNPCNG